MAAIEMVSGAPGAVVVDGVAFELRSFEWASPDRLELAGRFTGLQRMRPSEPVLVLRGDEPTRRLPRAAGTGAWPPADDAEWRGAFAWEAAPVPFDAAELEVAPGMAVGLPMPGAEPAVATPLNVTRGLRGGDDDPSREEGAPRPAPVPSSAPVPAASAADAPSVRSSEQPAAAADGRAPGATAPEQRFGAGEPAPRSALPAPAGEHDRIERLAAELRAVREELQALRTRLDDLEPLAGSAAAIRAGADAARSGDDAGPAPAVAETASGGQHPEQTPSPARPAPKRAPAKRRHRRPRRRRKATR